jgi:hypothetical protein
MVLNTGVSSTEASVIAETAGTQGVSMHRKATAISFVQGTI